MVWLGIHIRRCVIFAPSDSSAITGSMLSHLNEGKTVTLLPVDPLFPLEESPVGPEEEEESSRPAAQPAPKRGQSRGRRAKGRRPGAAAASKNKGERGKRGSLV